MADCRWLIKPIEKVGRELEYYNLTKLAEIVINNPDSFPERLHWAKNLVNGMIDVELNIQMKNIEKEKQE